MKYLVILLIAAAAPALADMEAHQGDDWVRFIEKPCSNETVKALLGPRADDYQAAVAHFGGQDFQACWAPRGNVMHLVYEDGDQGIVPVADIKPAREA